VADALGFYRDLLGLTVTDEGEDSGPDLERRRSR